MLNNHEEKYDLNEDSTEYHFSDDDMSYDTEQPMETVKPVPLQEKKAGLLGKLTQSKRMLITIVIFIVLVFVFYKMVMPTSSTPASTDINPAPTMQPVAQGPMSGNAPAANSKTNALVPPPALPVTNNQQTGSNPVAINPITQQPTVLNKPQPTEIQAAATTPLQSQAGTTAMSSPATGSPAQAPAVNTMPVNGALPAYQGQPMTQQSASVPVTEQQQQQLAAPSSTTGMPVNANNVPVSNQADNLGSAATNQIPMSSASSAMQNTASAAATMPPSQMVTTNAIDAMTAAVAKENERLVANVRNEYTQKINDYESQNKALQNQVQVLNARVETVETQLNQLVQALTRTAVSNGGQTNAPVPVQAPVPAQQDVAPKIAYTVQAIIPGRAWLRSDDGETITVAEGDLVQGVGRVTKIDPYNGVVEISTGSKIVSLAYGGGG